MKYNLEITLQLARLQTVEDIRQHSDRIKTAMRAVRVSVLESATPAEVVVRIVRRDPLADGLALPAFVEMLERPHGVHDAPWAIDEVGATVCLDFASRPHCLVAGTTGAGKSAIVSSMLAGLITSTPGPSLVLIDPKRVELASWAAAASASAMSEELLGLTAGSVRSLVSARFRWMEQRGIRNLNSAPEALSHLGGPLVCVVDELAEFLALAGKEGGSALSSIAQLGRAAGVFLIVATQNPKAELFSLKSGTETLRSNLNTLVAARVTRRSDSEVILGLGSAAEGQDASTLPADLPGVAWVSGRSELVRGAWLSDEQIEALADSHPAKFSLPELLERANSPLPTPITGA